MLDQLDLIKNMQYVLRITLISAFILISLAYVSYGIAVLVKVGEPFLSSQSYLFQELCASLITNIISCCWPPA